MMCRVTVSLTSNHASVPKHQTFHTPGHASRPPTAATGRSSRQITSTKPGVVKMSIASASGSVNRPANTSRRSISRMWCAT